MSAVGEEVDGDGPPRHEGIPGEGVGGGPRQGHKVLGGGLGVAADEYQGLEGTKICMKYYLRGESKHKI